VTVTLAMLCSLVLGQVLAGPVAAGGWVLYVDGKIGHDPAIGPTSSPTWGRSTSTPFKTVERALEEVRFAKPQAIRIKGYADYVYYETLDHAYRINGTAAAPVTIGPYTSAEGAATLVRPIISGGIDVGTSGWRRPSSTSYPNVWCKTWKPPAPNLLTGQAVIPGYESSLSSTRQDRLYLDVSQPLNRPVAAPTMAQLNAQPFSQYWNKSKATDNLCVHLGRWDGKAIKKDPAYHKITVPWYRGIILSGGSAYVTIRDLRIRHTIMGVGFSVNRDKAIGKAHHNAAVNVDSSYNYRMGFWTGGDDNTFDRISGSRNSIQLVKLDSGTWLDGSPYGAQRNVIKDARSTQNFSHGIKLYGKLTTHNVVGDTVFDNAGIPKAARNADQTQAVQISNGASYNTFRDNTIIGGDAGFELYQYNSSGGPLNGNLITRNRLLHVRFGVFLWDTKVNSAFGTGTTTFSHNVYYDTQTAIGGNGTKSGKVFDHETIYRSGFHDGPTSPSVDKAGIRLFTGSITVRNSIIDDTNGPSICAKSGATVYLSYSDTYRWRNDPRTKFPHGTYCYSTASYAYGKVVVGSGVVHVAPGYLSTDPASSSFLVIGSSSPLYGAASDGSRLGAH
jgi:hypothetical protein